MIKYFHELKEDEFKALCGSKMTWGECAKEYPQPEWCGYPDAICGVMGCWSLMSFMVTGRNYCKNCDHYIKRHKKEKQAIKNEPNNK